MNTFNKDAIRDAINQHALAIAQYYANGAHVTTYKHEVRIGNKGARVFDTRKGLYNDFETGTGGDGFFFVQALTGCSFAEVAHIVAAFAGGHLMAAPPTHQSTIREEEKRTHKRDYALKLWEQTYSLGGCHAVR